MTTPPKNKSAKAEVKAEKKPKVKCRALEVGHRSCGCPDCDPNGNYQHGK